jgi:sec-independent protein translocase protein TatA
MGISNPLHIAFIALVALLVLGPKRLPEVARSLGNGMREFRESLSAAAADNDETPAATHAIPVAQQGEQQAAEPAVVPVVVAPAEPAPAEPAPAEPAPAEPAPAAQAVEPPAPLAPQV